MTGMASKIINERKNAIDLFLIIFPASIIANIFADLCSNHLCIQIAIGFLMFCFLVYRYSITLTGKMSEYIFVQKLIIDKQQGKIVSNNNSGAKHSFSMRLSSVFEALNKKNPNLVTGILNGKDKEIWSLALDFYEVSIMATVAFGHWGGWEIVQTSKNTYSSKNKGGFTEISFEDYPAELRRKEFNF